MEESHGMSKIHNGGQRVLAKLAQHYPGAKTDLNYGSNFQLLVAVMLSAQTTDQQVNKVTARLFERYKTPEDFASLTHEELAEAIKGCGLFRTKAQNIILSSQMILEHYGGEVPTTMPDLLKLPGVGRKTANVVLGSAFGIPALAVDTHVFRVARRLGLADGKTPEMTEALLRQKIPQEDWVDAHHWLIQHGRKFCNARKPRCGECFLQRDCPDYAERLGSRR
jgi:endonuclease III